MLHASVRVVGMHLRTTARWVVVALAMAGGAGRVVGQAGGPAGGSPAAGGTASGGKLTCTIDHRTPSEPEKALRARRFADAERLFGEALTAAPASSDAMAGLVPTTLAEDKLPEALALAIKFDKEHPSDPVLIDALGEVRCRRGEVQEAANAFIQSNKLDPCNGLTHFDVARYLNLSGMYLSSQRQLEIAHTLSPDNPQIERRWRTTHAIPRTPDQQLAFLRERVANAPPSMTDEVKEGIQAAIKGIETREKGSCQLVSPVQETKLPIVPISNGVAQTQEDSQGAGREVRIGPLPKRPDEAPSKPTGLATSDVEETPLSIADRAKDPYVAPEMKDWTPVFRAGHDLIFPTMIGNAPVKLFMMDTGAQHGMITPAAAREVTHVSGNTDMRVRGINGEVKNVMFADRVTITFARVQQMLPDMTAYDSSMLAHTAGVEISGLIGFPTLRELVISIDYRDNLVHVVYDPKKGFHAH